MHAYFSILCFIQLIKGELSSMVKIVVRRLLPPADVQNIRIQAERREQFIEINEGKNDQRVGYGKLVNCRTEERLLTKELTFSEYLQVHQICSKLSPCITSFYNLNNSAREWLLFLFYSKAKETNEKLFAQSMHSLSQH